MKGITRKKSSAKNYLQYTCVYIYYFVFNLKKKINSKWPNSKETNEIRISW